MCEEMPNHKAKAFDAGHQGIKGPVAIAKPQVANCLRRPSGLSAMHFSLGHYRHFTSLHLANTDTHL